MDGQREEDMFRDRGGERKIGVETNIKREK